MKNKMIDLVANRCTYWKGKLYCAAKFCNLLFSVDVQDGTIELIDTIPKEEALVNHLSGYMTVWNDKLIISPNKTNTIWIYDLISKQWNGLAIREYDHWGFGGIYQIYEYKNKLFLIGGSYPAIVCLDPENNSCDYIEEPYKEVKARHPDINYYYFRAYGSRSENTLYLASCLDNYVLKFDMETLTHQWIKIGDVNCAHLGIAWDGDNFWLSPRSGSDIVKWDGNEETKAFSLPDELKQHSEYIWEACYDGKQIILPAINHPNSIMINLQNDTFEILKQQYFMYTRLDNGMVISQTADGDLSISAKDLPQKIFHISVETDQLIQFYEAKNLKMYKDQTLYKETRNNQVLSLDSFLGYIISGSKNKPESNGQIGKAIWENIR